MSKVYQIPGKLTVEYDATVRAIIDTWSSYTVSVDEFREAVLTRGLSHAKLYQARAWIVDSSSATGAFSSEINQLIAKEVFPAFVKNGIKHFITITAQSALTKLSIAGYTSQVGPSGMKLVEARSTNDAKEWLKANAKSA